MASPPSNQTTTVFRRDGGAPTAYRCVCGETFALASDEGGGCPACGRYFTGAALKEANSVTLALDENGTPFTQLDAIGREHDPYVGRTLSHYKIVNRLGQGGMGAVYLALDESLQRYVAVKVIRRRENRPYQAEEAQRLLQEAVAQARVNHPHVVHIYYVGFDGDDPFFAMELVNGPSLDRQLKEGPLPFPVVIELGLQIISALERSAAFDIVHGDIKPSNILLPEPYSVKLSDFGLARRMSSDRGDPDKVMGSPDYLSPEAIDGAPLDIRSDMYSLGVTLFEMTFGRLPYHHADSSVATRFNAHQTAPIAFPQPWPQPVPLEWRTVLERLMAKDPTQRYASYAEVAAALHRLRWVRKTPAGSFVRATAWLLDAAIGLLLSGVIMLPFVLFMMAPMLGYDPKAPPSERGDEWQAAIEMVEARKWLGAFGVTLGAISALGVGALLQMFWKTTPGKRLMQIRILDAYGNTPPPLMLFARFFVQAAPFTLAVFATVISTPQVIESILKMGAFFFVLIDWGAGLFSRDAVTLHDRFFGTRVVLDTTETTPASQP